MSDHTGYVEEVLGSAQEAAEAWARMDQDATDRVVTAIFRASFDRRVDLARMAFEETGIGVFEHKVRKNAWASLVVHEDVISARTVGEVGRDDAGGVVEIARPRGPVLAMTPLTNPTSTVIFKCLIAAKTRNPLIISPHRAARKCSREAARVCLEAAVEAGAPESAFQWIRKSHKDVLQEIMEHRRLALILATGTGDVVKWAQRSGNPVIGVGPGNVPVYVHDDADPVQAAREILHSKTFDNGTVCASEQALIVTREVHERIRPLLEADGTYFCSPEEAERLGAVAFDPERRSMSPAVVGRPAWDIAAKAEFEVPEGTRLLVARLQQVGRDEPLSHEILAPILAYYVVRDLEEAVERAEEVSRLGGVGHTLGLWTGSDDVVQRFVDRVPAGRVVVNQPATQAAIGGIYNVLPASLTLGTGRGNLTMDNVSLTHLLTTQRVLQRRENDGWFAFASADWLDESLRADAAQRRYRKPPA